MKSKIQRLKYEEILEIVIHNKDCLIFEAVNALNNVGNNVVVTPKIMALDMNMTLYYTDYETVYTFLK